MEWAQYTSVLEICSRSDKSPCYLPVLHKPHGHSLELSNNRAERAVKEIVMERKNWLVV